METKDIKSLFLNPYKSWENKGVFRKRVMEGEDKSLDLINSLADRWRQRPDSEGKRLVSKILSLYDKHNPILETILKDEPILFESQYSTGVPEYSRLYCLEIACLCGCKKLADYLIKSNEIEVKDSPNLLAYALSVGDGTFAYRLAHALKAKEYNHPECLSLYNKCSSKDLEIIQSFFEEGENKKEPFPPKINNI